MPESRGRGGGDQEMFVLFIGMNDLEKKQIFDF